MRVPKVWQKVTRLINKALNEWDKIGYKPNDVRYAESMIAAFHETYDKKLKQDDRLNNRMSLSADQMDEYIEMVQTISDMEIFAGDFYDEDIIKKWETAQRNTEFNDIRDYVAFIDDVNIYKKEKLIASVISYYKYNEIQEIGIKYSNMSENDINQFIIDAYMSTGYQGDQLYEFIIKNI